MERTGEELISVRKKGQVTLPLSMRKKLGIADGSIVLSKVVDNSIVLVPQETVDRDQAWFWKDEVAEARSGGREGHRRRPDQGL